MRRHVPSTHRFVNDMARAGRGATCLILSSLGVSSFAQSLEVPRNWFNDPFVQLASAIRACPEPLGPRVTKAERRLQAHHRAERGTTCFLAGRCEKPNAYLYDQGIAEALAARIRASVWPATSSLWITVQGRVAFIEGCAAQPSGRARTRSAGQGLVERGAGARRGLQWQGQGALCDAEPGHAVAKAVDASLPELSCPAGDGATSAHVQPAGIAHSPLRAHRCRASDVRRCSGKRRVAVSKSRGRQ